jgi:O-acetyl-ADP-ribose deacetylase (regulator of RNase III)
MSIYLHNVDIFKNREEGIILTVDGAAKGMEGNIARRFEREYPDAWEEIQDEIVYPLPLGRAQAVDIHPDYAHRNKTCFIASTLNHLDTLTEKQKLEVQSSALRHVLSLAEAKQISSIATTVMVGGWRLELTRALESMLSTIQRAKELSKLVPEVSIYILSEKEFSTAKQVFEKYA